MARPVANGCTALLPEPLVRPAAVADYAVIRVLVKDAGPAYSSTDPATGANPLQLNPLTGKTWALRY